MSPDTLLALLREALWLMALVSLPPLGASLLAGLLSSFLQAVTQLQESALSVVPKLAAAMLSLALAGPWIARQLLSFTRQLLLALPEVGS
jgi:flagellar biosynthesis protein FliQ